MTEERLVPKKSNTKDLVKSIARYNLALPYCSGKVIDIGCGVGYGTDLISQFASESFGIDLAYEAIEYAKANYKRDNLLFTRTDVYALSNMALSADAVVCFDTIPYLVDLPKFLKIVNKALVENGYFIYSLPITEVHTIEYLSGLTTYKPIIQSVQVGVNFYLHDEVQTSDKSWFVGVYQKCSI